jgi:hypothetical protein
MMQDAAGVFSANCHEGRATPLRMKDFAVTYTLTLPYRLFLIWERSRDLVHRRR